MKKSWEQFCVWVQGKRVAKTTVYDDSTVIEFTDGSSAKMTSTKTEGSEWYSEETPGSDGHLTTPEVDVTEGGEFYG